MNWIRSIPLYEKIAFLFIFSVLSFWIIELKNTPIVIGFRLKPVQEKIYIKKHEIARPYTYEEIDSLKHIKYLSMDYRPQYIYLMGDSIELDYREGRLDDYEDSLKNISTYFPNLGRFLNQEEWEQGYYLISTKKERLHVELNPLQFLVWILSVGLFYSAIYRKNKID